MKKWNRKIQFRGRRKNSNEWVVGYLIGTDVIVGKIVEWDSDYFCTEFWYKVDPETVGESTDIKDMEGNIAFEDDIVEGEEGKRFLVRWGINSNGFIAKSTEVHSNVYSSYHLIPKTKIVGNIHDNPELFNA